MTRIEIIERIQKMLISSRTKAGKSQAYMAKALNCSKTTVQNWENGTAPIQLVKVFEWFQAIDVPPAPYVWGLLHDSLDDLNADVADDKITAALIDFIKIMTPEHKKKLLYVLYGDHGSNPGAQLELMVAYNHLALREKLDVANVVRLDYKVAKDSGEITDDSMEPNMSLLDLALQAAYKSVTNSKNSYTISEDES